MDVAVKQIGKYKIQKELGRGGMAVVYHAINSDSGQHVALKVLPPTLANHANTLQRFLREGENASRLHHENIVQIYESAHEDGYYYIAMALISGQPLDEQIIDNGQLFSIDESVAILSELAAGLDYAHSKGIIHRDIKPANVLMSDEGCVMLADFGVARHMLMEQTMYTLAGQSVGTPAYMSPEQARGLQEIDYRADVYSFGVLAYKLLTGRVPFHSQDQMQIMRMVVMNQPTPAHEVNPEIPLHLSNVIQKCLEKNPKNRYESAGAFMGAMMSGYHPTEKVTLGKASSGNNDTSRRSEQSGFAWYDRALDKVKTSVAIPKVKVSSFEFNRETANQHPSSNPLSGRHLIQDNQRAKRITLAALTAGVFATALFFGNAWLDRQTALKELYNFTSQVEERLPSGELPDSVVELSKNGINTVKEKTGALIETSSELGNDAMGVANEHADIIAGAIEEQAAEIDLHEDEISTVVNTVWYPRHTIEKVQNSLGNSLNAASEWISNALSDE